MSVVSCGIVGLSREGGTFEEEVRVESLNRSRSKLINASILLMPLPSFDRMNDDSLHEQQHNCDFEETSGLNRRRQNKLICESNPMIKKTNEAIEDFVTWEERGGDATLLVSSNA